MQWSLREPWCAKATPPATTGRRAVLLAGSVAPHGTVWFNVPLIFWAHARFFNAHEWHIVASWSRKQICFSKLSIARMYVSILAYALSGVQIFFVTMFLAHGAISSLAVVIATSNRVGQGVVSISSVV